MDLVIAPAISYVTEIIKRRYPKVTSRQIVLVIAVIIGATMWLMSMYFPDLKTEEALAHAGTISALSMQYYNFFMKKNDIWNRGMETNK